MINAIRAVFRARRFSVGDAVELSPIATTALVNRFAGLTGTVTFVRANSVGVRFPGWGRCVVVIDGSHLMSR